MRIVSSLISSERRDWTVVQIYQLKIENKKKLGFVNYNFIIIRKHKLTEGFFAKISSALPNTK